MATLSSDAIAGMLPRWPFFSNGCCSILTKIRLEIFEIETVAGYPGKRVVRADG
jgi:hypothetical protein